MPTYNPIITALKLNEIRRYAGLHTVEFSEDMLLDACSKARILATPQATWEVYPYESDSASLHAATPLILQGESIREHLISCSYVAVLAVTIGRLLESTVTACFSKGEYTKGLLLDAAGTAAVEAAADQLDYIIAQAAYKLGCQTTRRFSPGYGDFNITIQSTILDLADASKIEVTANECSMLEPQKSITALIGFTADRKNITLPEACIKDTCPTCSQINCIARKENFE